MSVEGQLVQKLREALPGLKAAYLFGSQASGSAHGHSDFDLAVLGADRLDPLGRWDLQEELARIAGRPVDLVDLRSASTVMCVQVLSKGRIISDDHPTDRARFEMVQLADYADLNERRRGILEDIRARGSVYG